MVLGAARRLDSVIGCWVCNLFRKYCRLNDSSADHNSQRFSFMVVQFVVACQSTSS